MKQGRCDGWLDAVAGKRSDAMYRAAQHYQELPGLLLATSLNAGFCLVTE